MSKLEDKIALITGGNSGIGPATPKQFGKSKGTGTFSNELRAAALYGLLCHGPRKLL